MPTESSPPVSSVLVPADHAPPDAPPCRDDVAPPEPQRAIEAAPDAAVLGRMAESPAEIPWPGWKAVLRRTFHEMISDRASVVAAGCAFWATLALFPTMSMLVFIYGLVFDPVTVEPQLETLRTLLPPSAYALIADRIHTLVRQPPGTLTLGLVVSTLVTLWSATSGTKGLLAALNLAYEERETRSFLRYQFVAIGMTLGAIMAGAVALALLVALPAVAEFVGLSAYAKQLIRWASLAVLLVFVLTSLSLLYRFGPSRRMPKWHWVTPGSLLATVLWVVASALFSYYVGHIASYDATYGSLGAVAGVMMWFYVSVYVVLLGAELNSELELQTARDSTEGPPKPMGMRGAYVADHVAE